MKALLTPWKEWGYWNWKKDLVEADDLCKREDLNLLAIIFIRSIIIIDIDLNDYKQ